MATFVLPPRWHWVNYSNMARNLYTIAGQCVRYIPVIFRLFHGYGLLFYLLDRWYKRTQKHDNMTNRERSIKIAKQIVIVRLWIYTHMQWIRQNNSSFIQETKPASACLKKCSSFSFKYNKTTTNPICFM